MHMRTCLLLVVLSSSIIMAAWQCPCEEDSPDMEQLLQLQLEARVYEESNRGRSIQNVAYTARAVGSKPGPQQCTAGPDTEIVPGAKAMQYGFNIVTNETTERPVLDTTSRRYNATVWDHLSAKCYIVPDAFVAESIGVRFELADDSYDGEIDESLTDEARGNLNLVHPRQLLPLDNGSRKIGLSKVLGACGSRKAYQITHELTSFELNAITPLPTPNVLAQWKDLARTNMLSSEVGTLIEFEWYFKTMGTHFFVDGTFGKRFMVVFTTNRHAKKKSIPKVIDDSVDDCLASIVIKTFSGKTGNWTRSKKPIPAECARNPKEPANIEHMVHQSCMFCEGGEIDKCPTTMDQTKEFRGWRNWDESLSTHVLIRWQTRSVTNVIEEILTGAGFQTGIQGEMFRQIIADYDGSSDFQENVKQLTKFKDVMHEQLVNYLVREKYCKTSDQCYIS